MWQGILENVKKTDTVFAKPYQLQSTAVAEIALVHFMLVGLTASSPKLIIKPPLARGGAAGLRLGAHAHAGIVFTASWGYPPTALPDRRTSIRST